MLLRKELFDLKPFNDGYVLEKIDEYSKIIVPAKVGSYEQLRKRNNTRISIC